MVPLDSTQSCTVPTSLPFPKASKISSSHHSSPVGIVSVPWACAILNNQKAAQFAGIVFQLMRASKYPYRNTVLGPAPRFIVVIEESCGSLGVSVAAKTELVTVKSEADDGASYHIPLYQVYVPEPFGLKFKVLNSSSKIRLVYPAACAWRGAVGTEGGGAAVTVTVTD